MENTRKPYAIWRVDGRDIKLKLTTADVIDLEDKFKCNLISLFNHPSGFTPLSIMLAVVQKATNKFEHGISLKDVQDLYDDYLEAGGSLIDFTLNVFMEVFKVSGFLSQDQLNAMDKELDKIQQA